MPQPIPEEAGTDQVTLRLNAELLAWFHDRFPWRGSLPQFMNQCLAEFRQVMEGHQAPSELTSEAVKRVTERY